MLMIPCAVVSNYQLENKFFKSEITSIVVLLNILKYSDPAHLHLKAGGLSVCFVWNVNCQQVYFRDKFSPLNLKSDYICKDSSRIRCKLSPSSPSCKRKINSLTVD